MDKYNYPSLKQMAFNMTDALVTALSGIASKGVLLADKQTADARADICVRCEFFEPNISRCTKCGCFMKMKVNLSTSTCPEKKW